MESSGPDVDAGIPEKELTLIETHVIPAECVPEASPTRQVAQLLRDLGLGPHFGAPSAQFPPHAPSSADAARATPVTEKFADERFNRSDTDTSRVRAARHLKKEDKVVESQGRRSCAGFWRTMLSINHRCKHDVSEQ